jgi:cytochrome c-type biogenesis protein
MDALILAIGSAFWLGILTSISPCPLATNIAAVSYIGKRVGSPRQVLLAGLLFTLGRLITYVGLGVILVASLLAVPEVALFLQRSMNKVLGPMLIVVGLLLLGVLRIPGLGLTVGDRIQKRAERLGVWGAGLLGLLFALSFCPVSAALFFGSLIPLAAETGQSVLLPVVYGVGTALPVVGFAVLLAFGARFVGVVFSRVSKIEYWATRVTGAVMLVVGGYYSWLYLIM